MIPLEEHYLFPSALFVASKPYLITTVLGSCIAVCLFDSKNKIGGMNHFMLPLWNGDGLASARFGNISMEKLLQGMINKGAELRSMEAKVFGGANQSLFTTNIGERNIHIAEQFLASHKIRVSAKSVGGTRGRKIIFNNQDGVVKMKFVNSVYANHAA